MIVTVGFYWYFNTYQTNWLFKFVHTDPHNIYGSKLIIILASIFDNNLKLSSKHKQ